MTPHKVSEDDYQEFALWLAANPAHRSAMDTMLEMWGDLGAVRYLPEKSAPRTAPRHSTRRRWLATGVALAASVLIALVLSPRFNPGLNNRHTGGRLQYPPQHRFVAAGQFR